MNVEFSGFGRTELHREEVLIGGAVNGRPVRFRFTRDAVRSVAPPVADGRDLFARLTNQADVFSAVSARKPRVAGGETPGKLTITGRRCLRPRRAWGTPSPGGRRRPRASAGQRRHVKGRHPPRPRETTMPEAEHPAAVHARPQARVRADSAERLRVLSFFDRMIARLDDAAALAAAPKATPKASPEDG